MKVAIMAGGTGGHIFPGLAVAKELNKRNVQVVWLGAVGGMEEELVKKHNIPIKLLNIKGLRGKGIKGLITMPFRLLGATWNASKYFKQQQVNAVISMGGYVAAPGGLAAKLKKLPLLVHEQNSKFGMTNKYLSKWAKKVLTGFDLKGLYGSQWVGNPVRKNIEEMNMRNDQSERINVLIIGGSLGANALNTILPPLLKPLLNNKKIAIKHQCGKNKQEPTQQAYNTHDHLEIMPFIDDMSTAYAWADFIIARAGALTIAEINATALPAILIPYPHAVDDHQTENAKNIVDNDAGFIWQEHQEVALLNEFITTLVNDEKRRKNMAVQSQKLHKKDAAAQVAQICMEMIK